MKMLAQTQVCSHYKEVGFTPENDNKARYLKDSAGYTHSEPQAQGPVVSDEALMAGFASGNIKAFETLYTRHKGPLFRFFLRQVSNKSEAEELFQDTWQRLIKHSKSYKISAKFTTYLYHIARTRLIDLYRSHGRQKEFTQANDGWEDKAEGEQSCEPQSTLEYERSKQQFLGAVEKLPTLQREVVVMKLETGMTVNEIAEVVQEKPEAVKSRLRYGMDKLKHYLSDLEAEVAS
ncbi:RNA polymerase sigma factor [Kangiella japonica]|uniref:RNA polymerase sigma factor n=1 Tax=Kangiella japonica TaxID=647384 RepID=A0ABN0T212_9GAMM